MESTTMLEKLDGWRRAANYLSVGQIYLRDGEDVPEVRDRKWRA